ncbi:pyridoxal phosphate-dependent aminotransferase [Candidatus Anaplasma sp. TIGMIC]|uniref:pyridoxal phosphate-dependent aminotransferase n=1 Tax=Candidatus Anaplasma sp. TIGMIC TaxID=3020713 RepID=UPI00232A8854|nr:pyridoxal phosphate-dependent aminotransferase [Candidatus Anaplasma sp. TIGMIC]MDB1135697.1 pyridoxal phosphate-dependent aminotransferase [Candidatus Anaplasma sp. TIGMIC]
MLSKRMGCIKPSPTLELSRLTSELIAKGVDVISLGAGEPDFDTPDHIKNAAIAAINEGKTKYTPVEGIPELKDAIIHRMKTDYGVDYVANQVLVGSGAKQCIYNLLMATLNEEDEVIIPSPYWVSYPDIVKIAGGVPVIVDCGDDLLLTPKLLEEAITPKTKWLIINSPSNPSGAVYNREQLRGIADVLVRHQHVSVLSDDIYEKLVYDTEFLNILQVERSIYDRVYIVNGVSKAYSMTGWRIGYVVGNASVIKAVSTIQSQSTTNANSIAQYASVEALLGDHSFLIPRKQAFSQRRDMVMRTVVSSSVLKAVKPQGAFYVFVSCAGAIGKQAPGVGIINDGTDMAKHLLNHRVAVVSGSAFGAPDFFRISYALSDSRLSEACERILEACRNLS